ncbi:MAG: bifunctional serine/threonine-protein kinase/formylglycine-generating enzyme family protein [Planctomycetota bacterium]
MDSQPQDQTPDLPRCRSCNSPLNMDDETLDQDVSCHTCGSQTPLAPKESSGTQQGRMIGHFRLLELVGTGRFGAVYRALDTKLSRVVAIKIPRKDDFSLHTVHMFEREAKAAAALSHPNIVRLYEVVTIDGAKLIVSEFIFGDDLKVFLSADGFASTNEIIKFMLKTTEAVQHAHQHGVVHRDLKPGNILVDRDRQPHLTDFGLAKMEATEQTMTTYKDQLVGTLAYMSPEQASGRIHDAKAPSDIFSLGVILYELLTRQRPFPGETLTEIVGRIRNEEPIKPRMIRPDLPQDLETICLKALSKNPRDRYASAKAMANDLSLFLEGKPTVARPTTSLQRSLRWLRKNSTVALVCLAGLVSTAAAALIPSRLAPVFPEVELATDPPEAELRLFPINLTTGKIDDEKVIRPRRKTPFRYRIAPGDYLVVAKLDDDRFHEVIRRVPQEGQPAGMFNHCYWRRDNKGTVILSPIRIPAKEVADSMVFHDDEQGFYLDPHEVTTKEFCSIVVDHATMSNNSAESPMTRLTYNHALFYAELMGKRLPTADEIEFAATNSRKTRYPWGMEERKIPVGIVPVGEIPFDKTNAGVYGLCSNGGEFTRTYVRSEIDVGAHAAPLLKIPTVDQAIVSQFNSDQKSLVRVGRSTESHLHDVAFRCARSKTPRW